MTGPAIDKMLRFTHPERQFGYLPGMADALPALYGLTPEEYSAARARMSDAARSAARALLEASDFAARVDALPFSPGQTVLALGDSATGDLLSWVEVLRHLLALRSKEGVTVVNAGVTGQTSAMALRGWPSVLSVHAPDWVVCMLGGNDAVRVGPTAAKPLVRPSETVGNLTEVRRIAAARTRARWVWITPTPVDEERVRAFPPFGAAGLSWANADVEAIAGAVAGFADPVVDASEAVTGTEPFEPDGVHLSPDAQARLARLVVERLVRGR